MSSSFCMATLTATMIFGFAGTASSAAWSTQASETAAQLKSSLPLLKLVDDDDDDRRGWRGSRGWDDDDDDRRRNTRWRSRDDDDDD